MYICGLFTPHMAGDTKRLSSKWAQWVWQRLLPLCSLIGSSSEPCHPNIRMLNKPTWKRLKRFQTQVWISSWRSNVWSKQNIVQKSKCQKWLLISAPFKRDNIVSLLINKGLRATLFLGLSLHKQLQLLLVLCVLLRNMLPLTYQLSSWTLRRQGYLTNNDFRIFLFMMSNA